MNPMEVQLLVGLMYCRVRPESLQIVVGDRVRDTASATDRDVDITILSGDGVALGLLTGVEVKNEAKRLSVDDVEQLCAKLCDMPALSERNIVSTSGFAPAAVRKAHSKGVGLYELVDWKGDPRQALPTGVAHGLTSTPFHMVEIVHEWARVETPAWNPESKDRDAVIAAFPKDRPLLLKDGSPDPKARTIGDLFAQYLNAGITRWSETVPFANDWTNSEPPGRVLDEFPLELNVVADKDLFVQAAGQLKQVTGAQIRGIVRRRTVHRDVSYRTLLEHEARTPFASAVVSMLGDDQDRVLAMLFSPNDTLAQTQIFKLEGSHRNFLPKLRLK